MKTYLNWETLNAVFTCVYEVSWGRANNFSKKFNLFFFCGKISLTNSHSFGFLRIQIRIQKNGKERYLYACKIEKTIW